MAKVVAKWDS
jgi:hypothetical protein